jgi:hypothetical protein
MAAGCGVLSAAVVVIVFGALAYGLDRHDVRPAVAGLLRRLPRRTVAKVEARP